jgi:hypothetical protein
MHFGFMDVILLHIGNQHVSATHGDICSVVRTRMQILKCAGDGLVIDLPRTSLQFPAVHCSNIMFHQFAS